MLSVTTSTRLLLRRHRPLPLPCCVRGISGASSNEVSILDQKYRVDDTTNITQSILAKLPLRLHNQPAHPLGILRSKIESHFHDFAHVSSVHPVVTPAQNFDSLGFPTDHPGRSVTDSYYVNKDHMLRTHTSAHEVETFATGQSKWLLTADVYRRDEIDSSHYPVFHQMEGARVFKTDQAAVEELKADNGRLSRYLEQSNIVIEDIQHISPTNPVQPTHDPAHSELVALNLKLSINSLLLKLFGGGARDAPLQVRWIEAYFPFTSPSFEVEILYQGKWLEILGCGVVQQLTLDNAGKHLSSIALCSISLGPGIPDNISWAFGLGLERIAMILFGIPDIRLFWSTDPRFLSQFSENQITTFKPYSKYPACFKDVSFWVPGVGLHENDFCDLVRDIAGDLAEDVKMVGGQSTCRTPLADLFDPIDRFLHSS
jgi:phenylalanyl-tRNA synthetase alpha chain